MSLAVQRGFGDCPKDVYDEILVGVTLLLIIAFPFILWGLVALNFYIEGGNDSRKLPSKAPSGEPEIRAWIEEAFARRSVAEIGVLLHDSLPTLRGRLLIEEAANLAVEKLDVLNHNTKERGSAHSWEVADALFYRRGLELVRRECIMQGWKMVMDPIGATVSIEDA